MELVYHSPDIWTIANFLTERECDDLLLFSERMGYEEATVSLRSGAQMIKSLRNNERLLYEDQALADKYWQQLAPFCPKEIDGAIAVGLTEQFRFYKYDPGQRFKRHIDGRFRRNEFEESRITFMVYLNSDCEGGETAFDDLTIVPQVGMALCFIHELKHEGRPVTAGSKYVLRSDVMYRKA